MIKKEIDQLLDALLPKEEAQEVRVETIPISRMVPFKDHPFKVLEGEELDRLKESIEKTFKGYVKVVLNDCGDTRGWRNAGYYPEFGHDMNADFMDAFGRSPYYGDPEAYLATMLPVSGGMIRACGIY